MEVIKMAINSTPSSMYYRYFVYSAEEEALKQKIYGQNAEFGTGHEGRATSDEPVRNGRDPSQR